MYTALQRVTEVREEVGFILRRLVVRVNNHKLRYTSGHGVKSDIRV